MNKKKDKIITYSISLNERKRSFQLNHYAVFHYYYFVMFFHIYTHTSTKYVTSFNEHNVLDNNERRLVTKETSKSG
jgi:ribosomal protein S3AE